MKHLKSFTDNRGVLTLLEVGQDVPFAVERVFWIQNVPQGQTRGGHAHKELYEYVVAISGSLSICVDNGEEEKVYHLSPSTTGLLLSPGVWKVLRDFSADAIVLVLASHPYSPDDCLASYEDFLHYIKK